MEILAIGKIHGDAAAAAAAGPSPISATSF
jgi:hypothetical protein